VNDQDQESIRSWVEKERLPFPVILDNERMIAVAYGMSKAGDERYLADPTEGRRPAVIVDEEGLVLKWLPDLATVEGQMQVLSSLD
ncbi:peroxiredoxin family protein, partial [SAR202 cluster bacterium AD-802-F09_MRT_200m]|nr:peroxiredoxin family protein [SAR202 cluster bacterium AD-802-F09_MRT_200m]